MVKPDVAGVADDRDLLGPEHPPAVAGSLSFVARVDRAALAARSPCSAMSRSTRSFDQDFYPALAGLGRSGGFSLTSTAPG
jgi:hypothetical protein